jgi:signal transduction histidine kinase
VGHAVRVAGVATALIAVVYVGVMVVFDAVDSHHLVSQVDAHLASRLHGIDHADLAGPGPSPRVDADDEHDLDEAPVLLWRVGADGRPVAVSAGAPALPASIVPRSGAAVTADLGGQAFRLASRRVNGHLIVAGQSLAETNRVKRVVVVGEVIAGPLILAALFLGMVVIGVKASAPVEQTRRRQLEFTADASHELRTPLSVIEAEVALALRAQRSPEQYRAALERVGSESERLQHLVEELLWLARFDSEPPPPGDEPVDLGAIADTSAERFAAVARAQRIGLSVIEPDEDGPALISAPAEWIDRLAGVLVDNACRHASDGGTVRLVVTCRGNRAALAVEDSGPGVAPEDRDRLFDRFYRATTSGSGAGLGLAIADSVVRGTGGRWRIDDSALGGALMEVSWHRAGPRGPATPTPRARDRRPAVYDGPIPDPDAASVANRP